MGSHHGLNVLHEDSRMVIQKEMDWYLFIWHARRDNKRLLSFVGRYQKSDNINYMTIHYQVIMHTYLSNHTI
jgi:hypothetical protein